MAKPSAEVATNIVVDARVRRALRRARDGISKDDIQGLFVISRELPIAYDPKKRAVVGLFLGIVPDSILDSTGRRTPREGFEELIKKYGTSDSAPRAREGATEERPKWFRFLHPLKLGGDGPSFASLERVLAGATDTARTQMQAWQSIGLELAASGQYGPDLAYSATDAHFRPTDLLIDETHPELGSWTGAGAIVAIIDAGCDVAHPNFRDLVSGKTRIVRLIDQNTTGTWDAAAIDGWLATANPYATYDPHANDFGDATDPNHASHGTHVLDIAAGNGGCGSKRGVAPEAGLVFIHVKVNPVDGKVDFTQLAAGIESAFAAAGAKPCVANVSLSDNAGPHTAMWRETKELDDLIAAANPNPGVDPCRAVVVSAGNNHGLGLHVGRRLTAAAPSASWQWAINDADTTTNTMQIWYAGASRLSVALVAPGADARTGAQKLPENQAVGVPVNITEGRNVVGEMSHVVHADLTDLQCVEILVDGPSRGASRWSNWTVTVSDASGADRCVDAWLLRDQVPVVEATQSRLLPSQAIDHECTIGQLACASRVIAAGAHVGSAPAPKRLFTASSSGPTRDDPASTRPDVTAPGVKVMAAWSKHGGQAVKTTRMTGTSMAAPHVAGAIALMLGKNPTLTIDQIRGVLRDSADDSPAWVADARHGAGRLDVGEALKRTPAAAAAPGAPAAPAAPAASRCRQVEQDA